MIRKIAIGVIIVLLSAAISQLFEPLRSATVSFFLTQTCRYSSSCMSSASSFDCPLAVLVHHDPSRLNVVISNFDPPLSPYQFSEYLRGALSGNTALKLIQCPQIDQDTAALLAHRYGNLVVLWGQYGITNSSAHVFMHVQISDKILGSLQNLGQIYKEAIVPSPNLPPVSRSLFDRFVYQSSGLPIVESLYIANMVLGIGDYNKERCALASSQFSEAIKQAKRSRSAVESYFGYSALGTVHLACGQANLAIRDFKDAFAMTHNPSALVGLSTAEDSDAHNGGRILALKDCSMALGLDPHNVDAHIRCANEEKVEGAVCFTDCSSNSIWLRRSIEDFNFVRLSDQSETAESDAGLGDDYFYLGDPANALLYARAAVSMSPDLYNYWLYLGRAAAIGNLQQDAQDAFDRARYLAPDSDSRYLVDVLAGAAYVKAGAIYPAIVEFSSAYSIKKSGPAVSDLCNAYLFYLNDAEAALPYCERSVAQDASELSNRYSLRAAYMRLGRVANVKLESRAINLIMKNLPSTKPDRLLTVAYGLRHIQTYQLQELRWRAEFKGQRAAEQYKLLQ